MDTKGKWSLKEVIESRKICEKELFEIEQRYLLDKEYYKQRIKKIRASCPHDCNWTFHSDPSGNNDSYYSCPACGKESKRML